MSKSVIIIGSGFAGLSAASFMARDGWQVTVLEKNLTPGGRARQLKTAGFVFDMGPSFYWMPDILQRYFELFGRKVSDYYTLERLDPSYRVYWQEDYTNIPADFTELKKLFESIEKGSSQKLEQYLAEAARKYEVGIHHIVHKPGLSITEFFDWTILREAFRLDIFVSIRKHIRKYFSHPRLQQLMEFPVLFLGALPQDTPALYSLMNYADIKGGTWYPQGGMYAVVEGMYKLALELGVQFRFEENAKEIVVENGIARKVVTDRGHYEADAVISAADYHFTEKELLPASCRSYSDSYWEKKVMAPSCLLYYIGVNKKLDNVTHHSLFFDTSLEKHGREIYTDPRWPSEPLFYASISSITDPGAAPEGCENIVLLIPVAAGLEGDDPSLRESYFQKVMARLEKHTGQKIMDFIIFKQSYSITDFVYDYNSFRGNAYGLANTLRQTAIFRPACRSRKVKNLFYAGQLTVPGPGVPPSLISGEVAAKQLIKVI